MKYLIFGLVFSAITLLPTLPCTAQEEQVTNEQLLQEIRALREKVDKLQEQVDELSEESDFPDFEELKMRLDDEAGADISALSKIKLPDDPTNDDVAKYIRAIQSVSRGQNTFSTIDPQPRMLAKVGPDHVSTLIDFMDNRLGGMDDMYFIEALEQLVDEEHKELVLERLSTHHSLAKIVLINGWEDEARETLIEGLKYNGGYLPDEWVSAVIELDDESLYPLLAEYFAESQNPEMVYNAIRHLPGIN